MDVVADGVLLLLLLLRFVFPRSLFVVLVSLLSWSVCCPCLLSWLVCSHDRLVLGNRGVLSWGVLWNHGVLGVFFCILGNL